MCATFARFTAQGRGLTLHPPAGQAAEVNGKVPRVAPRGAPPTARGTTPLQPQPSAKLESVAAVHAVHVLAKCAELNTVLELEVIAAIAGLENYSVLVRKCGADASRSPQTVFAIFAARFREDPPSRGGQRYTLAQWRAAPCDRHMCWYVYT